MEDMESKYASLQFKRSLGSGLGSVSILKREVSSAVGYERVREALVFGTEKHLVLFTEVSCVRVEGEKERKEGEIGLMSEGKALCSFCRKGSDLLNGKSESLSIGEKVRFTVFSADDCDILD